ncbi:MAG TPA: hypothetical protein VLL08_05675, partial [Kineosporiaceae bacterium]|nr:hypothetical protein [Kineosporiaceae bacterium]
MPSPGVPDWKEASRGGRRSMRGSLPAQLSPLVGRGREIGQVKALVTKHRLVTLTGVGGVGKTRLALQVATDLRRQFSDGAWFVDLTHLQASQLPGPEVRDPDLIAHVVLLALGMPQRAGGSPVEMLISYLTDRQTLVVLDNCEQVGPACAVFVDQLLVACAGVRVLATSREPIAVGGEVIYPVQPLPVPDRDRRADLRDLTRYESVALFVTRAQAVTPGFTLTHHNRDAVAELCRRLDGLPLAIELAVARVRVLAPQQILERVNDRFALLSRGRRDAPGRQQTLRACVEWSFDLCGKPERVLWARLSVFVGGFTLDAVESVCCDELLPAHDLVDVLAGLVDKSIVDRLDPGGDRSGPVRYRMLETIRDYGMERLAQAGDQALFRARHRDWCRELVAAAGAGWSSHRQPYWQARLTEEQPNVRAAIEFCLATPGEAEMVFPIVELMPRAYWGSGV